MNLLSIFEKTKNLFSDSDIALILDWIEENDFRNTFPEDIIESRTSWEDLRDSLYKAECAASALLLKLVNILQQEK